MMISKTDELSKIYTDELNQCLSCDFVADFYKNYKGECVCPQCNSTDYYILNEGEQ